MVLLKSSKSIPGHGHFLPHPFQFGDVECELLTVGLSKHETLLYREGTEHVKIVIETCLGVV